MRRCFVSTRFDPHGILLPSPGATLCAWLRQRAAVALELCRRRLLGDGDWRQLFELNTSAVDVLWQLLPGEEPQTAEAAEELVAGESFESKGLKPFNVISQSASL